MIPCRLSVLLPLLSVLTSPVCAQTTLPTPAPSSNSAHNEIEILETLFAARAANFPRIHTWQGKAAIEQTDHEVNGAVDKRSATASFFLDIKNDSVKWTWSYTSVSLLHNGHDESSPKFVPEFSNMTTLKTRDIFATYWPGITPRIVLRSPDSPQAQRAGQSGFSDEFDPRWYLRGTNGIDIDEYVRMVLKCKRDGDQAFRVSRDKSTVTILSPTPDHNFCRWEFDLSQGGNRTLETGSFFDASQLISYRIEYHCENLNTIWVPTEFHYTRTLLGDIPLESRTIKFIQPLVNTPIAPEEFTVAGIHAPEGTAIQHDSKSESTPK